MRYKTQEGGVNGGKFSVIDTWYHTGQSSVFIVCECSVIETAEKIVSALNEWDGHMGQPNLPRTIEV